MIEFPPEHQSKIRPYFLDDDPPEPMITERHEVNEISDHHRYRAGTRLTKYWLMAMASSSQAFVMVTNARLPLHSFVFITDFTNLEWILGICLILFIISCLITMIPFAIILNMLHRVRPAILYRIFFSQMLIVMIVLRVWDEVGIYIHHLPFTYGGISILYFFLFMQEWKQSDPEGYSKSVD